MVAASPSDAGAGKPKKKPHGGHRRPAGGGPMAAGDEGGWTGNDTVEEGPAPQLIPLTPADRALEWRGDDTSQRPGKIDMANNAESRSLDDGEIQSTIGSQSGPAQTCVTTAATNTNLSGTITIKMVVDGNGRVIKSKLQAPHYMFEHGLLACVKGALARMHFPATGASTLVTMPINFS